MKNLSNRRIWIIGMAIQNLIFFLFFYLQLIVVGGEPWIKVIGWQLIFTSLIWESTRLSIRIARKRYPGLQQLGSRIITLLLLLLIFSTVIGCWHVWMEVLLGFWEHREANTYSYLYSVGMTLFFSQLIAGVYEALYYLDQWKKAVQKSEALEKRNLQSRFDSLKNQVSPHFLFNSLNSLTALVEEDPKRAVRFIEELAAMYRYLLQSNEQQLISLKREVEFTEAYTYLLKTRFEQGLQLEISIDPALEDYLIPPLTLQMLVENAVKHNMISLASPLSINIYTDEEQRLVVVNKLQKRNNSVASNKTGLVNISAKFALLNQPDIVISETDTHFKVMVPLLKNYSNEYSYH